MNNLRVKSGLSIYVLIVLIGLFGVVFLFNFLHIFTISDGEGKASATSATSEASVAIAPNLSITATDATATIQPEASGNFTSATSTITVSSNNKTGYSLYLSSNSSNVDLVNVSDNTYKISSISSNTTESALRNDPSLRNHYGFTTDNNGSGEGQIPVGTYLPVTSLGTNTLIKKTSTNENVSTTNVTFSTTVDKDLPSGTYTNEVLLTAIANTNPNVFMQDFTAEECNQLDEWSYDATTQTIHEGDTITLYDRRDMNSYRVSHLADGNCWMTENLRLDLDSSTALTPDTTNITSDWTPSTSTQKDSTQVQWTPDCNGDGSTTVDDIPCAADTPRSYKVGSGILGDTQTTNTNHGNYYSWSAATAGTRNTDVGAGEATGDICPKGWRLPTNAGNKSWHNLLFTTYGLTDRSAASNAKALAAPFYLLYSGDYDWSDSRVYSQGSGDYWWSSTAYSASDARTLYMSTTPRLIPQNANYRTHGFSVRCVIK